MTRIANDQFKIQISETLILKCNDSKFIVENLTTTDISFDVITDVFNFLKMRLLNAEIQKFIDETKQYKILHFENRLIIEKLI